MVAPEGGVETPSIDEEAFAGEGKAVNSGPLLDALPTAEAKKVIVQELEKKSRGAAVINYRLRDWVFSRYDFFFFLLLPYISFRDSSISSPIPPPPSHLLFSTQATLLGRAHPHLLPR